MTYGFFPLMLPNSINVIPMNKKIKIFMVELGLCCNPESLLVPLDL